MNVLLVDDHAIVRAGFRRLLVEAFGNIGFGEAGNAAEAIEAARASPWDVIILDISMPGRSGLDALLELREIAPRTPVLVMTMYGEKEYAVRAFRNGASGYLTKDSAAEEVVAAVRKLVSGGRYVTHALAEHLVSHLRADPDKPLHEALSDREFQVFRMLAMGNTVKAIGHDLHLSEKTVSTYRTRLLGKMHMQSTAELVRYAVRANLVD